MIDKKYTESEIEKALYNSRFTDPHHKETLRQKLFGKQNRTGTTSSYRMLSDEELEMAAGGLAEHTGKPKEDPFRK